MYPGGCIPRGGAGGILSLRQRNKSRFLPLYYSYRRLVREARGNHKSHNISHSSIVANRRLPSVANGSHSSRQWQCHPGRGRPYGRGGRGGGLSILPPSSEEAFVRRLSTWREMARDGARVESMTGPFRPPGRADCLYYPPPPPPAVAAAAAAAAASASLGVGSPWRRRRNGHQARMQTRRNDEGEQLPTPPS